MTIIFQEVTPPPSSWVSKIWHKFVAFIRRLGNKQ